MPKDANPNKRKATDAPVSLFDNTSRPFVSRRFTEVNTSDTLAASRFKVRSCVTPGPQPSLFGNLEEDIYAMPYVFEPGDDDRTEIDATPFLGPPGGSSVTAEGESIAALPGLKITQKLPFKRYVNSVRQPALVASQTYPNRSLIDF